MGTEPTDHVRVYESDLDRIHDHTDRGERYADTVREALDALDAQLDEQGQETEETEA